MNKRILLTAVLTVFSLSVFAQTQYSVGVIGGAGANFVAIKDELKPSYAEKGKANSANFGWSAGLKADATINPYFAVELDLLFANIGYTSTYTPSDADDSTVYYKDVTGSQTSVYEGNVFQFNLLARPQYPVGPGSVFALVGLGLQGEVGKGTLKTAKGTEELGESVGFDKDRETIENSTPYQALTLPVGLGYQMPLGPGMISLDARYNFLVARMSANKGLWCGSTAEDAKTLENSIWTDRTDQPTCDGVQEMVKLSNFRVMIGYTYLF